MLFHVRWRFHDLLWLSLCNVILACDETFSNTNWKHVMEEHESFMRFSAANSPNIPLEYHPIQFLKGAVDPKAWGEACSNAIYDNGYWIRQQSFTNEYLEEKFGADRSRWPFVSSSGKYVEPMKHDSNNPHRIVRGVWFGTYGTGWGLFYIPTLPVQNNMHTTTYRFLENRLWILGHRNQTLTPTLSLAPVTKKNTLNLFNRQLEGATRYLIFDKFEINIKFVIFNLLTMYFVLKIHYLNFGDLKFDFWVKFEFLIPGSFSRIQCNKL